MFVAGSAVEEGQALWPGVVEEHLESVRSSIRLDFGNSLSQAQGVLYLVYPWLVSRMAHLALLRQDWSSKQRETL